MQYHNHFMYTVCHCACATVLPLEDVYNYQWECLFFYRYRFNTNFPIPFSNVCEWRKFVPFCFRLSNVIPVIVWDFPPTSRHYTTSTFSLSNGCSFIPFRSFPIPNHSPNGQANDILMIFVSEVVMPSTIAFKCF